MAAIAPSRPARATQAPDFTLQAAGGATVQLADYRGRTGVVLFFMRAYT